MSSVDTRTFKRYKKETAFKLKLKTETYDCKTVDYSADGICLHILSDTFTLLTGDNLEFTIHDPELKFHGQVVWIKEADIGYKVGLRRTGNLEGICSDFQLADIMIGLQRTMKTGVLEISQGMKLTRIYIKNGDYIFAISNQKDDRLGEFLIKRGSITKQQYLNMNEKMKISGKRPGKILVELGYLKPSEVYKVIKEHVENIILSIFTVECGNFEFKDCPLPTEETITLNISAATLIYKGVKTITNSQYILDDFPSSDSILCLSQNPADLFQYIVFDDKAKEMLSMVNSKNTIGKILQACPAGDFEAVKTIYALLCARIIVIKTDDEHQKVSPEEIIREPRQEIDANFIKELNELFDTYKTLRLYDILGAPADATDKEIKMIYWKKARKYHPDKHFDYKEADIKGKLNEVFTQINFAYSILSNPAKRIQYDKSLLKEPVKETSNTKKAEEFFNEGKSIMNDTKLYDMFGEENKKMMFRKYTKAERLFCEAIYFDNSNSEYHFYHGIVLSSLSKLKDALKAFEKAIELNPSKSSYYAELGHVFLNLGFKHRARSAFDKALKISRSDQRAREGMNILEKP